MFSEFEPTILGMTILGIKIGRALPQVCIALGGVSARFLFEKGHLPDADQGETG
jgi:hypothetical protein